MKQNNIVFWCARISGILLMLNTLPHHFIGIQVAVLQPIAEGKITDPEVGDGFYLIWILSSVMMFLIGTTLLFIAADLRNLQRRAWKLALLICLGLGGFGTFAAIRFPDAAALMSVFVVVSTITLIPLLIFVRSYYGGDASSS